jgi:hypothetical protein
MVSLSQLIMGILYLILIRSVLMTSRHSILPSVVCVCVCVYLFNVQVHVACYALCSD